MSRSLRSARRASRAIVLACLVGCGGREDAQDDATSDAYVDDVSTLPDDARSIDTAPTFDSTLVDTSDATDTTPSDTCPDQYGADYGGEVRPLHCPAPISDDVTFDFAPSPSMCAESSDHTFQRWPCACRGYRAITYDVVGGCVVIQLFDESTNAHVAKMKLCGGWPWTCLEGPPSVDVPSPGCLYERRPVDAGVAVEHCASP